MATNLTRINNNQITDASAGNVYLGVNAASKLQNYTITSAKLANNLNYDSSLTITGNLTVSGTTTTVDTVNTLIEDPLLVLASGQTSGNATVDIGYIGLRGASDNIALAWKESASEFVAAFTLTDQGNVYSNTTFTIASYADFKAANITANSNLVVNGTTSFVGNIVSTANVTGNLNAGNLSAVTLVSSGGNVSASSFLTGANLSLSGNVDGNLNVTTSVNGGNIVGVALVSSGGNVSASSFLTGANLSLSGNVDGNLNVTTNVNGGNLVAVGNVSAGGNITTGSFFVGDGFYISNINAGNVSVNKIFNGGSFANIASANANLVVAIGNSSNTVATFYDTGVDLAGTLSVNGNVISNSFLTGANLSLTGNVDGNLNVTTSVNGGNLVAVTLVSSGGNVSASSFLTGANLSLSGNVDGNLNVTSTVTGGNLLATTLISSGGNIYAQTDITAGGNVTGGNVTTGGYVTAVGNVTGGNINTANIVSAGGNVIGGNVLYGSGFVSGTGNVYGGNLVSNLAITAIGDITGGNIYTANVVSAGGNVTGSNLNTGNIVSAAGNVIGGNIYAASSGDISTAGNVWGGVGVNTPNVVASGALALTAQGGDVNISASGNIGVSGLYIKNLADPIANQDAATKYYVDSVAQGLTVIASTFAVTPTTLANISGGTVTYNNGNAGVGANLVTTGIYANIDGVSIAVANTRILVTAQANTVENGVYVFSNATVLTRASDFNTAAQIQAGDFVFNQYGNVYGNTQWVQTSNVTAVGTSPITWTQFGGTGSLQAGNGIAIVGTVISARVDTTTIDFSGTGNLQVSANAAFVSPNIGNATGTSLSVGGNVTGGNLLAVSFISSGGNISSNSFLTGANLSLSGNVDGNLNVTSTVTGGNIVGAALVSSGGNVSASSFLTGANLSLTGNVDGNLNVTTSVNGGNLVAVTLVSSGGNVSASSFLTGANLSLSGNVDGNLNVTTNVNSGNVYVVADVSAGGNINTSGYVSALGNITTGNFFIGDGYYISNINPGNVAITKIFNGGSFANIASANANLVVAIGNSSNSVATFYDQGINITGLLSVNGNVIAGNISIAGASGNITGANVISATTLTASGNVFAGTGFYTGNIIIPNTGNIDAGTNYINNVIDPQAAQDAATKAYVDGFISGGITISDGANTTALALDGTLSLVGTANQVNVQITNTDEVTFSLPANVSVTGNVHAGNILLNNAVRAGNVFASNIIIGGSTGNDITSVSNGRVNFNSALNTVDFAVNGTAANVFYVSATNNSASFGSSAQTVNAIVAFNTSTSILAPVGNTNQRPSTGVTGMVRFNNTTNSLEIYNNTEWQSVGSTVFTVVEDQQFTGDGTNVAFTLNSTQTTNSVIVSINGVLQIPTTAYSVSGVDPTCVLTFTEAPEPGDSIDVRGITTTTTVSSITNSGDTAVLAADPTLAQINITGNLIPTSNVLQTLGNATNQWQSLYVSGNTIYLGGLQLQATGNTFAVLEGDGTTPATLEVGNIDVSSITAGTSSLGFRGTNGNAFITVNSTANVLTATTTGVSVIGTITANGNISGSYILGNGYALTSINGANVVGLNTAAISNGTSNVTIATSNGSITAGVGGTPDVAVIATTGVSVTGTVQANGTVTGGNLSAGSGFISTSGNVTGGNVIYGTGVVSGTGTVSAATVNAATIGNTGAAFTGASISAATIGNSGATLTGTLQTAAQTNITSVGTLSSLAVTGTVSAATVNAATIGNASAVLNGATVSATGNVTGGNIIATGVLISSNTVSVAGNITGGNISTTGTATIGGFTISANTIVSSGSTLTIDPNASGGVDGLVVIAGNLQVNGNTTTINSNVVSTNDLTVNYANNAINSAAANGGGIEVGPIGSPFITWLYTSTSNVWATAGGISATGQVTGSQFNGSGAGLTSIPGGNVSGAVAFATTANAVAGANVSGTVSSATTAGTVTTGAQGNITSVGTLTALTVSGAITVNANNNATAIVNGGTANIGNIGASGAGFNTVFAKATTAQYADLAEKYSADAEYQPGTVVSFGGDNEITLSDTDADPRIAGVVSTNPAYSMNSGLNSEFTAMIALTGRVPCSVIGPVRKGDMMVSAGNGQARAEANPKLGTVIGKALENFDGESGVIEVVVGRL